MFCNKCGNKIDDKSSFCSWCGARIEAPAAPRAPQENPTEKEPEAAVNTVPAGVSAAPGQEVPAGSAPQFGSTPGAQFQGIAAAKPTDSSAAPGVTRPVETAKSGWSTNVQITEKPQTPENPEKPRKYYTGAHLALCLVTTGIMAMAAGVFAALYFMGI